jgi:phosphoglycerate kinase
VEVDDDLRRDEREKSNDIEMAKELARGFDVYVNDAFSVSHRKHTSMVALPKLMRDEGKKVFAGLRLSKELEVLDGVMSRQTKKLLVVGGAKSEDKAKMAIVLAGKFDRVLVGGVLAKAMRDQAAVTGQELPSNIVLGGLREDGLDLNEETMQIYVKAIGQAEVVVLAGPMGMYEQETSAKGTGVVFAAVAYGGAFKVAGGGNTEVALHKFGLVEKFDWVSVGGGAMLEYLAVGKLVAVEALIS